MKMLSLVAVALVLSGFAATAEEEKKPVPPSSSQAEQEGAPVGTKVQTAGKVTSVHSVTMVGTSDPHMLVKLETAQGDVDIVDLGSTAQLKDNGIEPKEGQQFWVDGRVGKINDKFLIVAERLSESKLVQISRSAALREETTKHAEARNEGRTATDVAAIQDKDAKAPKTETVDAGQQIRTVEGTVIHSRHVKLDGENDEHVLAKIQTEKGIAVVDLGTCSAMPNTVDLTEGKMLAATGYVGKLNGKPIIVADSVGNMSGIQRPEARETVPASSVQTNPNK